MNITFAHDHHFVSDGAHVYSKGGITPETLDRYRKGNSKLTVLCRIQRIEGLNKRLRRVSSEPHLRFQAVPNVRSLRGIRHLRKAISIITESIKESDRVFCRLPSTIGLLSSLIAKRHGIPYCVEVVGNAFDANFFHGSIFGKLIAPAEHIATRRAVLKAAHVVYITESYLQKTYPTKGKSYICPNVTVFRAPSELILAREHRAESGTRVRLGLVGSLDVAYKGHKTAIEALAILRQHFGIDATLHLLGRGKRQKWEAMARSNKIKDFVSFDGVRPSGSDVMEWLDEIDFLVAPSLAEGQGRSIVEAMGRGCPVVGSRVGGITELLPESMLCEPRAPAAFAEAVNSLFINKTQWKSAIQRNWQFVIQFAPETIAKKRRDLLEDLIRLNG